MTFKARLRPWFFKLIPLNRRTFDIVRFEIGCVWQAFKNIVNPFYWGKRLWLSRQRQLRVNLGAGDHVIDGWINTDARSTKKKCFITLDIRRKLPFGDGQVRFILAEHIIEHIDFSDDIPKTLKEMHRVLEPGGILRIAVPDAERFMQAYVSKDPKKWRELNWDVENLPPGIETPVHAINHIFHQDGEHLFAYDFETLKRVLNRAGFQTVERRGFQESALPGYQFDLPLHAHYSLYVEAVK